MLKKDRAFSACMQGKSTKLPFNGHFKAVDHPLAVVHVNLVDPISPSTNGGMQYFLTLVDQYTGYIHTVIMKEKSQSKKAIKDYQNFFEKQTGHKLKKLHSDGGGEFCNKELTEILTAEGIQHNVSPPYTPQNNGLAERANQTIIDMTRCLMMQANAAPEWWGEAVKMAKATSNCLPSLSKIKMTPIELMFKMKPNPNFF